MGLGRVLDGFGEGFGMGLGGFGRVWEPFGRSWGLLLAFAKRLAAFWLRVAAFCYFGLLWAVFCTFSLVLAAFAAFAYVFACSCCCGPCSHLWLHASTTLLRFRSSRSLLRQVYVPARF